MQPGARRERPGAQRVIVAPAQPKKEKAKAAKKERGTDRAQAKLALIYLRGEGTPLDDHRASAAYRAAMMGQSLLKFHDETTAGASR